MKVHEPFPLKICVLGCAAIFIFDLTVYHIEVSGELVARKNPFQHLVTSH